MFNKGDRVSENGRIGVVEKMHRNGKVVDVLFDDMDYAIRRQVEDVKKMRKNSVYGRVDAKPAIVFSGKYVGYTNKALIFETEKYGTLFIPKSHESVLFRVITSNDNLNIVGASPDSRHMLYRDLRENMKRSALFKQEVDGLPRNVDLAAVSEWWANTNGIQNEPEYEKFFIRTGYGAKNIRPPLMSEWTLKNSPKNLENYVEYMRVAGVVPWQFYHLAYNIDEKLSRQSARMVNEMERKPGEGKRLDDGIKAFIRSVQPMLKKNPRKPRQNPTRYFFRMNPNYTTQIPLIIGCGASKNPGRLPVNQKYSKGYWATYRKNTPSMPNTDVATYVLSAKYGILPETAMINDYDKVIVSDSKRTLAKNEVRASKVAQKIATQLEPQVVLLVGGAAYAEALTLAGFTPILLEDLNDFPGRSTRGGLGKKNMALKWFVSTFMPSRRAIVPQRVATPRQRARGATTSSVVANLATPDGFVKTLYQIRVNGIYKGEVRRALGLRSNASFGKGRKRLDLRLSRAERRRLLNLAFGAATQAMRKEGMLAKTGAKNMFRIPKTKMKLLVDKNRSRTEIYYTTRIAEFEKALELTRKK